MVLSEAGVLSYMLTKHSLVIDAPRFIDRATSFIKAHLKASNLNGVIVCISGGLDSSVTLALCVRALGGGNVIALNMPERGVTPEEDVRDAMSLAEELNVRCDIIEITPVMNVMRSILPLYDPGNLIATGNLKPRIRMTIAYHYANSLRLLVVGSSNKTELLLGYFTKYGDGACDIMPIGDLYKTQVRQIAGYLGIPSRIIDKAPSARLWPGQNSEVELGMRFEQLDMILYGWEVGLKPSEIARELNIELERVEGVLERVRLNEHKRRLPLILKLS